MGAGMGSMDLGHRRGELRGALNESAMVSAFNIGIRAPNGMGQYIYYMENYDDTRRTDYPDYRLYDRDGQAV